MGELISDNQGCNSLVRTMSCRLKDSHAVSSLGRLEGLMSEQQRWMNSSELHIRHKTNNSTFIEEDEGIWTFIQNHMRK